MKIWLNEAISKLEQSIGSVPVELNELDWKLDISPDKKKLAEHLSAFANYENGGFLAFGILDDGKAVGVNKEQSDNIIKKLGNIAREGIEPAIQLDHAICEFQKKQILICYIEQSTDRPVHLRGKDIYCSYTRSAGQTRPLTKSEVKTLISRSTHNTFEKEISVSKIAPEEVLKLLDVQAFFDMLDKTYPKEISGYLDQLEREGLIRKTGDTFSITNLGAILFSKNLNNFENLKRKAVRVVVYDGNSKVQAVKEQEGVKGYATGFEGLLSYIVDQLPTSEVIEQATRKQVKVYPELALREIVANALIHQDFDLSGTGPMIEIFSDRIEITNPGKALIQADRFIGSPPRSRNEFLASLMRRLNLCEERGSGSQKIFSQIELYQLPPPNIEQLENHFKITLYAPKTVAQMTKSERMRACFQHACLKHLVGDPMSNQSLRERLAISDSNYPLASSIIRDTVAQGKIKLLDPEGKSKRHMKYIPYWA